MYNTQPLQFAYEMRVCIRVFFPAISELANESAKVGRNNIYGSCIIGFSPPRIETISSSETRPNIIHPQTVNLGRANINKMPAALFNHRPVSRYTSKLCKVTANYFCFALLSKLIPFSCFLSTLLLEKFLNGWPPFQAVQARNVSGRIINFVEKL